MQHSLKIKQGYVIRLTMRKQSTKSQGHKQQGCHCLYKDNVMYSIIR